VVKQLAILDLGAVREGWPAWSFRELVGLRKVLLLVAKEVVAYRYLLFYFEELL